MKIILNKFKFLTVLLITLFIVPYALAEAPKTDAININTAPLEELTKLSGVGPKYAQRIIDHREKVAPFSQPEDIMKVEGIGQKIFEANKNVIVVK
jgi:competence protein ComEA